MKKFSNITGEKVGQQPEVKFDKVVEEKNQFKSVVRSLLDNFLSVQIYGPITRYHVAGTMKVTGQEMFIEALMDMLEEYNIQGKIKLLEGLKSETTDWQVIDGKVNEMESLLEKITDSKLVKHREVIKSLYKRYKDDKDLLIQQVEKSAQKIKNANIAHWRSIAAENMASESEYPNKLMKDIAKIYGFRAQQLGPRITK
jgi:hypothetical protein